MNDTADFVTLINDELGLDVVPDEVDQPLDTIVGWDSVQLVRLLTVLEKVTGRPVSFPDMLAATTLGQIFRLAVGHERN
ncbi:phosphopantetheine-binding protein [Nocardia takedensis]|uniref:acyl carrier protein n=1 Tax=Nocardia takedensis TaxID=259390 RepID=UPI000594998F|nr:acyl carrier protein [Nocardia takedensis]